MTSEAIPIEKRQSMEKPVTTKDIANLYSHLQTMMENVPKSPRLEQVTSLDGFLLTPTTSSSLNVLKNNNTSKISVTSSVSTPVRKSREPDCPCHHLFVSKDSEHCALCDDVIPVLSEIQQDREQKRKDIQDLKENLTKEQTQSKKLQQEITQLEKKSQQVNETLKKTQEEYDSLKEDMKILELKCITEGKEADQARKEKADVENELEELSQKLFEEANGMVANEKREKHLLEVQYKHLQEELKLCKEQIEAEELQLKELKLKMGLMDEQSHHRTSSTASFSSVENTSDQTDNIEQRTVRDLTGFFVHNSTEPAEETEDALILDEFKEFVESGETIPIRKLHSSSTFMKNTLVEDIEPCLRFGPNSRLSPKKLYEAILLNTCFIEEAPYGFAQDQAKRPFDVPLKISASKNMIWERLSSAPTAPFAGCQACGRNTKNLPYRFRISMLDDWACIDRYCRDQLVSVCEFYVFVRNIRQGYYNGRNVADLYQESLRLKLQMFYARMGALPQKLEQLGIQGDKIGRASEPNMIIPSLTTSNIVTDSLYITDTPTDNSPTASENEDEEIEKPKISSYSTVHPSNSVWIPHAF